MPGRNAEFFRANDESWTHGRVSSIQQSWKGGKGEARVTRSRQESSMLPLLGTLEVYSWLKWNVLPDLVKDIFSLTHTHTLSLFRRGLINAQSAYPELGCQPASCSRTCGSPYSPSILNPALCMPSHPPAFDPHDAFFLFVSFPFSFEPASGWAPKNAHPGTSRWPDEPSKGKGTATSRACHTHPQAARAGPL